MEDCGMGDCVMRVDKLANGYTVEVLDPEISAANKKRDNSKTYTPYKEPWKEYVFKTDTEAVAFITKVLPKLQPSNDDMGTFFNQACAEDD